MHASPTRSPFTALALIIALLGFLATTASAQVKPPKAGGYYEETALHGFKFKAPKDWEPTPPGPENANLVISFMPPRGQGMRLGGEVVAVGVHVLLFDSTISGEEYAKRLKTKNAPDAKTYIDRFLEAKSWELAEKNPVDTEFKCKEKGLFGTTSDYRGKRQSMLVDQRTRERSQEIYDVGAWTAEFALSDTKTLAIVGYGPGDKKDWKKWVKGMQGMAKTFERIPLEAAELGEDAANLSGPRLDRYNEINSKLPPSGGWRVYVSPNYFVVSNCDDEDFIHEIQDRMEAIRVVLERDFPLENAYAGGPPLDVESMLTEAGRAEYEALETEEEKQAFLDDVRKEMEKKQDRSKAGDVSNAVRSTMSVVKIFQDRQSYLDYGAPNGSAGYWWGLTEELCLYEDKSGGRNSTYQTLFHEGFHQYMFYYCGGLRGVDLHGWFDEGNADYYGGYEYSRKKVTEEEFTKRRDTIRQMAKDGTQCPLAMFLGWYQREYYGQNELDISQGENYAHGWSLVNFLRRGKKEKAKGWKDEWADLIPTYLRVALETGDAEKALDESFRKIDIDELEAAWLDFTG